MVPRGQILLNAGNLWLFLFCLVRLRNCYHAFGYSRVHCSNGQCFGNLSTVQSMQQDNSVVMTALVLRFWQQTQLGVVLQTEHTTGAHLPIKVLLKFLDSPTGSMTSWASTTAACGLTTATTTSNTVRPVTAGVTSHPAQVTESLIMIQFICFSRFL